MTAPASSSDAQLLAEIERLRSMLERQPSCLMRVAVSGRLLAVNEAALGFLGGRTLAQVLGTSIIERIDGNNGSEIWRDFASRVSNAGSASAESEMTDLGGVRRAVILQGVTLPAHPDGDESLLVTVRDVSTARRLQASLQEQEDNIQNLRSRLAELTVECDRLRTTADGAIDDRKQLAAALAQLKSALNTAIDATLLAQQVIGKGGQK